MIRRLFALICALAATLPVAAGTVAIVHANLLTVGPQGDIQSGVIIVRDGRIAAVGQSVPIPADARVIDAAGKVVTPGLIAAVTPLALNDVVGFNAAGVGTRNDRVTAAFDIRFSINPDSPQIPEARIEGVTRAIVTPSDIGAPSGSADPRIFAGQAAAIHLGTGYDLLVKADVALVMDGGSTGGERVGGGQGAQIALLRQALLDTREFAANTASYDAGRMRKLLLSRTDLQALVPMAQGREPLLIEVNRASDIHALVKLAQEQKLRLILSGASEAWLVADEIAAAHIPVILNADENEAMTFENLNASYENAAILQRAGVLVAYKPSVARILFMIRTPRFVAGRTVRYGMTHAQALAAITLNPARIFGLDDRFGSIEPGKEADLVVWSADPLETTSVAERVFIRGEEQAMTSRSRELRNRYIGAIRTLAH